MKPKWKQVKAPTTWRPAPGDVLSGRYCGRTKQDGHYGQYEVVLVLCDDGKVWKASGTMIIQLTDVALLTRGDEIQIKFLGVKALDEERTLKQFELYVKEKDDFTCKECEGRGIKQDFSTSMDNYYECPKCKGSGRSDTTHIGSLRIEDMVTIL